MKNCYGKGGKIADGGDDPTVMKEAKKKTIGMISGQPISSRADKAPMRKASGGAVLSPAAANSPMACAAKPGRGNSA